VTVFNKLKIQNSSRLETNWTNKIVTVLRSLFCVFGLWKIVTILYFQFVEDGHYFVFSFCFKTATIFYYKIVTIFHKPKTQNSDRLETNWKNKIVTVFNKPKTQNSDRLETNWKKQNSDRLQQTENIGHYFVFSICGRPSLFCIFSLLKTATILYFRFVDGGHYFVFSVCWRWSLFYKQTENTK
jgi:hypothetical protein